MSNVCQDQNVFNNAVSTAIKKMKDDKKYEESVQKNPVGSIGVILYLFLTIFAVILAMRVQDKALRTIHVFIALIASPLYLISRIF